MKDVRVVKPARQAEVGTLSGELFFSADASPEGAKPRTMKVVSAHVREDGEMVAVLREDKDR